MVDMSCGGWEGWRFAPYGKARTWRIQAPDGQFFTLGDLLALRENQADVNTLTAQVTRLRTMQLPLSHDDFLTVEATYFILQGLLTMFSPAITNTVFERRPAPRAFNLTRNNQTVFTETP